MFSLIFTACPAIDSFEQDVEIDGVIWANSNVDAKGNFATKPQNFGMFYQWNRDTPWKTSGSVTGFPSSASASGSWEVANNPCPTGYRVPTKVEFQKLINATEYKWTKVGGVQGGLFKDIATGKSIFLPAVGGRQGFNAVVYHTGTQCFYWSATSDSGTSAWAFIFEDGWISVENNPGKDWGASIRCVRN